MLTADKEMEQLKKKKENLIILPLYFENRQSYILGAKLHMVLSWNDF